MGTIFISSSLLTFFISVFSETHFHLKFFITIYFARQSVNKTKLLKIWGLSTDLVNIVSRTEFVSYDINTSTNINKQQH